jgi:hypothetical protein
LNVVGRTFQSVEKGACSARTATEMVRAENVPYELRRRVVSAVVSDHRRRVLEKHPPNASPDPSGKQPLRHCPIPQPRVPTCREPRVRFIAAPPKWLGGTSSSQSAFQSFAVQRGARRVTSGIGYVALRKWLRLRKLATMCESHRRRTRLHREGLEPSTR